MELLKIENLSFTYPTCQTPALSDLTLALDAGGFYLLCGPTGCGKSTLLRAIKRELRPQGVLSGRVSYLGAPLDALPDARAAFEIGYVGQDVEMQIVTDKVWHELVFVLENMGMPRGDIAKRLAETAHYFGIDDLLEKNINELSGGQKQLLNLAAVMASDPKLLLLDEPTAQLDPIAASSFIAAVKRLCVDFGVTVLLAEHRLEELIPLCDRMIVLDGGRLHACGTPREVCADLRPDDKFLPYMPLPVRLFARTKKGENCPLTLREGREYLSALPLTAPDEQPAPNETRRAALSFDKVYLRYGKNERDVLNGLTLDVYEGEIFCLLGSNGSGKTTALKAAAKLLRPYSGQIRVFGRKLQDYKGQSLYNACLALLPQDAQTLFLRATVREELRDAHVEDLSLPFDFTPLLDKHPYDLSGGEQQLLALTTVLGAHPRLLLLDEPTKGLDAHKKEELCAILRALQKQGCTVVAVTHDVEFSAAVANRAALLFDGSVASLDPPEKFFLSNRFFTTAARKLTRGLCDGIATERQLFDAIGEGTAC